MAQPIKATLGTKETRVKINSGLLALGSPGLDRQRSLVTFFFFLSFVLGDFVLF